METRNLTLAQFHSSEGDSVEEVRAWILVIHYSFHGDVDMFRAKNEADVQNLKSTFNEYRNCKFKDLASPKFSEISQILSEDGLNKLFNNSNENKEKEPNLLMLFILSHGQENGKILTDTKKDGVYEFFSTFEVWDVLANNALLHNSLKINFFGPCRGHFKEIRTNEAVAVPARLNATRILQSSNKRNFINFFSTVESTLSYVDLNLGSSLVSAFTKTLKGLTEDVEVEELLRMVAKSVINSCCLTDTQTPQYSIFPHNKLIFCKRPCPCPPVQNDAHACFRNLITSERHEYYPWISHNNKFFKRGTALVCGLSKNDFEEQLIESLKTLEFEPQFVPLSKTEETLFNVAISGLMESDGCVIIVTKSTIVDLGIQNHSNSSETTAFDQQCSGLAVNLGNGGHVPIGTMMQNFVNSSSPTLTGKPKIFIFIDSNITDEGMSSTHSNNLMYQMTSTNDHSGFLACICNNEDALLRGLKDPRLVKGNASLQEILTKVVCESRNGQNDLERTVLPQVWSTMYLKLDFPKCKDLYIPHNFRNQQDTSNIVPFSELVQVFEEENDKIVMIIAPPGMGKSRASEEIYTQLLVMFPNYFIVHVRMTTKIKTIDELMNNPKVVHENVEELFLKNCVSETKSAELSARLAQGRVFIILDGFDEVCPDYRDNTIELMKKLNSRGARILVTSRPQEEEHIQNSFQNICTYELLEFNKKEKLLMLKTRLHLPEEECENLLSNLEKSLKDFASNPLHLHMICEIYQDNKQELKNVYVLYEKFVEQKVEQGLAKCRQVDRNTYSFNKIRTRIIKLLEKCAIKLIMVRKNQSHTLSDAEVEDINISGIAIVKYGSSVVDFVHRTFAEFLTGRRIVALVKDPISNIIELNDYFHNVHKISGVVQTLKFADGGLADVIIKSSVFLTVLGQKVRVAVFNSVCIVGLPETYNLLSKATGNEYINNLIKESHESSEFSDWLFLQACGSSIELAEKMIDACPQLDNALPKLNEALEWLAQRNSSSAAFSVFLRKVPKWNTVDINISSFFSREQFEFLIDNVPGLLNRLVYDLKNDKGEPVPPTRESLILQFEKRNKTKNKLFCNQHHEYELARNVDSKIRNYRFTYKSSAALEACVQGDVFKLRDLHAQGKVLNEQNSCGLAAIHKAATLQDTTCLRFLIKCALGHLFVPNQDELKNVHRSESDWNLVEKELCVQDKEGYSPLHWASETIMGEETFILLLSNILGEYYVMEGKEIKPRTDEEQKLIERMLHTPDCLGRTPLSLVVDRGNSPVVFQILLLNMLGRLFVPVDGSCISERSAEDQARVERLLCGKGRAGTGIINNVALSQNILKPFVALVVSNLLGELYVVDGNATRERSNHEQKLVEKLINSPNEDRRTPLSYVINKGHFEAFEILLQNLLGDLFIPLDGRICAPRTAKKAECVERILCCRDSADQMPIHWAIFAFVENIAIVELLTRNILAEQFVFKGEEMLAKRTGKEQASVTKLSNPSNKQKKTLLELAENEGNVGAVNVLKRNVHVYVIPSVGKSVLTGFFKFAKFCAILLFVFAFPYIVSNYAHK